MDASELREKLARVIPAVTAAGEYARAEAAALVLGGGSLDVRAKADPTDFVTRVDEELEERLGGFLRAGFPGTGLLAEEGSREDTEASEVWVLDPLDGTRNFIRGHPGYCISLGLVREGTPVLGIIYDITADHLYTAVRGGGAFRNGRPLRVNTEQRAQQAVVGVGLPAPGLAEEANVRKYLQLMKNTAALRQGGSVARELALVAAGSLDAFWQPFLSPWDVAAGLILVEEAGGRCELSGGRDWLHAGSLGVLAASEAAFPAVARLLEAGGSEA